MGDQRSSLKAEYNFWMMALSSVGGALSIISLVQRVFRIGLAPFLQSIVDYYRGLLRPIVDPILWFFGWVGATLTAMVPQWLYAVPWRFLNWLWEFLAYYVLFGWLVHWLAPGVYAWIVRLLHWQQNLPTETYRDLYLLSFVLTVPFFRAMVAQNSEVNEDTDFVFILSVLAIPAAAWFSYGLLGLYIPIWAIFVAAIRDPDDMDLTNGATQYLISLAAMAGAAVVFFALNGVVS